MFDMVCHRFCPQALAEALKVNKTLTNIGLSSIGTEGAKAWCLGRGFVAPGFAMVRDLRDFSDVRQLSGVRMFPKHFLNRTGDHQCAQITVHNSQPVQMQFTPPLHSHTLMSQHSSRTILKTQ